MGKKSTPTVPQAPDPIATAEAQGKINEAAIIRSAEINQMREVNNYGETYYTGTIGEADRTKTFKFNDGKQAIEDSRDNVMLGLSNLAGSAVDNLELPKFEIDQGDVPVFQYDSSNRGYQGGGQLSGAYGGNSANIRGASASGVGGVAAASGSTSLANIGSSESKIKGIGNYSYDNSGLPTYSNSDRVELDNEKFADIERQDSTDIADSDFSYYLSKLQPEFDRQQSAFSQQMVDRGIPVSSAAYGDAMKQMNNPQEAALADAAFRAQQSGRAHSNTMFEQDLNQRGMNITNNTNQQSLQLQQQGLDDAENARLNDFALNSYTADKQLQSDAYKNNLANYSAQTGAENARYGINQQAQASQNSNNTARYAAQLSANSNNYATQMSANSNNYRTSSSNQIASIQAAEAARLNSFNMDSQTYGMQVDARNQRINEQVLTRNQPINELAALMQGSAALPTPSNQTAQYQVEGADYQSAVGLNYQGQMNAYNSQVAQQSSMWGGLFGLGKAAIGAFV